jgi:hypothetical protein
MANTLDSGAVEQAICDAWGKDPAPFKIDPHHLIPGPNT